MLLMACEDPSVKIGESPLAEAGADQTGYVSVELSFDGSGSSDDGSIKSYVWDFGDGTQGNGVNTSHTYTSTGSFTVTLTVEDNEGNSDSDTLTVTIEEFTGYTISGSIRFENVNDATPGYVGILLYKDFDPENYLDCFQYTELFHNGSDDTISYSLNHLPPDYYAGIIAMKFINNEDWAIGSSRSIELMADPEEIFQLNENMTINLDMEISAENYENEPDISTNIYSVFSNYLLVNETVNLYATIWDVGNGASSITSISWDMGDGSTYTGASISHSYSEAGKYHVSCTAENDLGVTMTEVGQAFVWDDNNGGTVTIIVE